ncbi:MAG TPA: glycoside hydrolase family 15 protein [Pirellulales bacterium]|nr:glycoside hydrolase family 15 protein [Pirellulales bacterium]
MQKLVLKQLPRLLTPHTPKQKALVAGAAGLVAAGAGVWAWRKFSSQLAVAPGWPGKTPYWSSSAKQAIGTALDRNSPVWFTIHQGILTEVYYPRADQPSIQRMGFIITGPRGFYSDEMQDAQHEVRFPAEGVPVVQLTNTCHQGRYRLEKTIFSHPHQPAVLQFTRFIPLRGRLEDYHIHVFVEPHLGNQGWRNSAWVAKHKGRPMLLARREGHAMALGATVEWRRASAGYHGVSDGRRQLVRRGRLKQVYRQAPRGNVSLIAEVDCQQHDGEFLLALGFGESTSEAGFRVQDSLLADWHELQARYVHDWKQWQQQLAVHEPPEPGGRDLYRTSTMTLRAHEDKHVPGAFVASLSIPWGEARKTNDKFGPVGYHVVWPRDLFMTASGLLAAGDAASARRALDYLQATQQEQGNWSQNQAVNGKPVWTGKQLAETAMAILLLNLLNREGALTAHDRRRYWPMVRSAVAHMVQLGPSAQEDRWEDAAGFTPFSLATIITAFLVAAELADEQFENGIATYLRETADSWCSSLEDWTYVTGTDLAKRVGVPGYYLRVAPPDSDGDPDKYRGHAEYWYKPLMFKESKTPADVVSVDALAYVRFGLRPPDDPRIVHTAKVIDALLKVDTPRGPCWRPYNGDGYGEQRDGSPFDGKRGIGRLWPLLTGERAHYELLAGRRDEAVQLLSAMEQFAGDGGLIPEQIWDTHDIPERGLYFGRPSGSAMPLAWAHAEYVKLRRSLAEGRVYDLPPQTWQRYIVEKTQSPHILWALNHRRRTMPAGKILRIQADTPGRVTWHAGSVANGRPIELRETGLGMYYADLPTADLPVGTEVRFHFQWPKGKWINKKEWFITWSDSVRIESARTPEYEMAASS